MFENFDMEKVKAKDKLKRTLSCRVTEKEYQWIVQNRISATALFRYCLKELINQENKSAKKK